MAIWRLGAPAREIAQSRPLDNAARSPLDRSPKDTGRSADRIGKVMVVDGATRMPGIRADVGRMAALKTQPRDEAESIHLRTLLEAALSMAQEPDRDWVTGPLLRFGAAIDTQDKTVLASLRRDLQVAHEAALRLR